MPTTKRRNDTPAAKVEGGSETQVRTAAESSGTNLLGLGISPSSSARCSSGPGHQLAENIPDCTDLVVRYRAAVERADEIPEGCTDLGAPVPRPGRPAPSLRRARTHRIEATGRHAGHADIIRD
ncbi:DUF664 domain-containing protein [Nocardia sp. NPDC050710]|uniref:mycothiol transferase n=1 Tax=Nocardia sp. NPDC050710 TaxID=3157220 RepID=UPI0033CADC8C